jgi:hypothetical protein
VTKLNTSKYSTNAVKPIGKVNTSLWHYHIFVKNNIAAIIAGAYWAGGKILNRVPSTSAIRKYGLPDYIWGKMIIGFPYAPYTNFQMKNVETVVDFFGRVFWFKKFH